MLVSGAALVMKKPGKWRERTCTHAHGRALEHGCWSSCALEGRVSGVAVSRQVLKAAAVLGDELCEPLARLDLFLVQREGSSWVVRVSLAEDPQRQT